MDHYMMLRYGCIGLLRLMATPRSEGDGVRTSASAAIDGLMTASKEAVLANAFASVWNTQIAVQMQAAIARFDAATGALSKLVDAYGMADIAQASAASDAAAATADDIPPLLTTVSENLRKGMR